MDCTGETRNPCLVLHNNANHLTIPPDRPDSVSFQSNGHPQQFLQPTQTYQPSQQQPSSSFGLQQPSLTPQLNHLNASQNVLNSSVNQQQNYSVNAQLNYSSVQQVQAGEVQGNGQQIQPFTPPHLSRNAVSPFVVQQSYNQQQQHLYQKQQQNFAATKLQSGQAQGNGKEVQPFPPYLSRNTSPYFIQQAQSQNQQQQYLYNQQQWANAQIQKQRQWQQPFSSCRARELPVIQSHNQNQYSSCFKDELFLDLLRKALQSSTSEIQENSLTVPLTRQGSGLPGLQTKDNFPEVVPRSLQPEENSLAVPVNCSFTGHRLPSPEEEDSQVIPNNWLASPLLQRDQGYLTLPLTIPLQQKQEHQQQQQQQQQQNNQYSNLFNEDINNKLVDSLNSMAEDFNGCQGSPFSPKQQEDEYCNLFNEDHHKNFGNTLSSVVKDFDGSRLHPSFDQQGFETHELSLYFDANINPLITLDNSQLMHNPFGINGNEECLKLEELERTKYRGVSRVKNAAARFVGFSYSKLDGPKRKCTQIYLGTYRDPIQCARAADLAALKCNGITVPLNFPINNYTEELEIMKTMSREKYISYLKSKYSNGHRKRRRKDDQNEKPRRMRVPRGHRPT